MRVIKRVVIAFASFVILPATVFAQASLSGFIKDSSGGVLPGVTVEASSPVLIEKMRSGDQRFNRSVPDSRSAARAPTTSPSLCPASPPSGAKASS